MLHVLRFSAGTCVRCLFDKATIELDDGLALLSFIFSLNWVRKVYAADIREDWVLASVEDPIYSKLACGRLNFTLLDS